MTQKRPKGFQRGADHPLAIYTPEQVARAKRMLIDAPRETRLAPGEMRRISEVTGIHPKQLKNIRDEACWAWVEPASADA